MKNNYQAILFHPEGDYVTDFTGRATVQEVWEEIAEMGSRWIFYPLGFVATDKTIIDTPEGLEFLKGKRITTVQKYLARNWEINKDGICEVINDCMPLSFCYDEESFTTI